MSTAVATIGIRGTEYVLELNAVLYGHVAQGAVEVCNAAGCLIVPGGQAFFVAAPSSLPVFTEKRAMLSPRPRELATVTSKIGAAAGSGSEAAPHHSDRPEQSQPTEPAGADAAGSANLMRPGSVRVHGAGADAPPVTPQPGRDASAMSEEPGSSARQANNAGTFAVTQGSNSGPGAGGPPNRGVPPGASNDAPQSPPGNPSLPSVARSLSSALGVLNAASLNGGAPAQFPGAGNGVGNGPPR